MNSSIILGEIIKAALIKIVYTNNGKNEYMYVTVRPFLLF